MKNPLKRNKITAKQNDVKNIPMHYLGKKTVIPYEEGKSHNAFIVGSSLSQKKDIAIANIINAAKYPEAQQNLIITDMRDDLYYDTHNQLTEAGYDVYHIDFSKFKSEHKFDFFNYMSTEEEAIEMADMLIDSQSNEFRETDSDPFWNDSVKKILRVILVYMANHRDYTESQIETFKKHLNGFIDYQTKGDEKYQNMYLEYYNQIKEYNSRESEHKFLYEKVYDDYLFVKSGPSFASLVLMLESKFECLNSKAVTDYLKNDYVKIYTLFNSKTAIFIETNIEDRTYNFLTEIFLKLCIREINKRNGTQSLITRFILSDYHVLDLSEFPFAGEISDKISFDAIFQSVEEIETVFKNADKKSLPLKVDAYILADHFVDDYRLQSQAIIHWQKVSKDDNSTLEITKTVEGLKSIMKDTQEIILIKGQKPVLDDFPYKRVAVRNEHKINKPLEDF